MSTDKNEALRELAREAYCEAREAGNHETDALVIALDAAIASLSAPVAVEGVDATPLDVLQCDVFAAVANALHKRKCNDAMIHAVAREVSAALTTPSGTAGEAVAKLQILHAGTGRRMEFLPAAGDLPDGVYMLCTTPPSASSSAAAGAEELARCKSSRERWIAMSCEFEHRLETLRSSLWSIVEHWKRRADESEYGPAYASCADEIKAELIDDAATPPSASSTHGRERAALREIIAVLGPEPPSGLSSGAAWEWAKALQVAKAAYAAPSASSSAEAAPLDDEDGDAPEPTAIDIARAEGYSDGVRFAETSAAAGAVDDQPMTTDRDRFHQWMSRHWKYPDDFKRREGGEYENLYVEGAWSIWAAALTTQREDRADG